MIFESHAHYDDEAFDEDRETLLASMQENGIEYIINVGADLASTGRSIALAERYPFIYAAVGVHPDGVGELNEENFQWLREQCAHPKAVAVGEIGLDYYWDTAPRQQQREWFVRQMELAVETKLPVIIHSREAAQETFELISQHHAHTTGGVIHCYSYSKEMALEYKITSRKTASILDTFSCIFQGVIPYGAQMLVAISAAKELGFELSAFQIMPKLFYPMLLLVSSLIAIFGIKGGDDK